MPAFNEPPPSPLEEAIAKRERKTWEFEAANFMAHGPAMGKYRMRVATVAEQDNALLMARRYVREKAQAAGENVEETIKDADLLGNAKVAYLMQAVTLRIDKDLPAFQSGKWMMEKLSTDELSVLLNHYTEILRLSGPIDLDLSEERLEGLAALLAAYSKSDAPNVALTPFTREQLAEMCVRFVMMKRMQETRDTEPPPDEAA